jgi:hypothetical protein
MARIGSSGPVVHQYPGFSVMCLDHQDILFVIGNTQSCFVFSTDNLAVELDRSLYHVHDELKELDFIQINGYTIINTRFFVAKKPKRRITLKGGSLHKVSRNSWKHFKDMPTEF